MQYISLRFSLQIFFYDLLWIFVKISIRIFEVRLECVYTDELNAKWEESMSLKPETLPFPDHARVVMRTVRGAFSELLTSLGANPQDPQAISRRFGLNKNLAWKISKIIQADDLSLALQQMPGAAGMKIFLRSIERAGASPILLQTTREALDEYERLIKVHSGDRTTLEMMGSDLSPAGRQQRDEYYRKLHFQGTSYIWGVQARVSMKVGITGPSDEPGLLDFVSLSALIDFRRLRPDVTWIMAVRRARNDDGTDMNILIPEAVDPRYNGEEHAPLMADFCSQPLPELRRFRDQAGTNFELVEGPVGNTGAATCVVGTIQRRLPFYRTPSNTIGEHTAICDTPAELLVFDLFVHKSFTYAIPPEASLYSELGASIPYPGRGRERNRLPLNEPLQDLGTGPLPLATPEVPRYSQMIQTLFDRMKWDPTEFHGFRMKIAYPAVPASVILRYNLPDAP